MSEYNESSGGVSGEQMYQESGLLFFKFRYVFAGLFAIAFFLIATSALVTVIGSNTALNTKAHPYTNQPDINMDYSPNAITAGASRLEENTHYAMLSAGSNLYEACKSITTATTQSGKSVVHGSAVVVDGAGKSVMLAGRGVGSIAKGTVVGAVFVARGAGDVVIGTSNGIAFVAKGFGRGIIFTLHIPGKALASITGKHTVSSIIKPAESDSKPVPVISTETSAAALATLKPAQQQKVAKLQTAQRAANRSLNGKIVAGDPNHGGYPSKWAYSSQDSSIDSWGMYNRECVSYTAWKVYQTFGHMPYWGGVGNANEWPADARNSGIPTGSVPKVHSVAVSMDGYYGHAMWVEKVRGNMIYVSQYNYYLNGQYSEMWVNGSNFTYIYFNYT